MVLQVETCRCLHSRTILGSRSILGPFSSILVHSRPFSSHSRPILVPFSSILVHSRSILVHSRPFSFILVPFSARSILVPCSVPSILGPFSQLPSFWTATRSSCSCSPFHSLQPVPYGRPGFGHCKYSFTSRIASFRSRRIYR